MGHQYLLKIGKFYYMLHHWDSTSNSALILASSSGLSIISMQVIARALAMSKVYFWAFGSPAEKNKTFYS